jgi:excisionase family DNA binding protein
MTMQIEKRAFSIDEFCARYNVGRTTTYAEIKAGRLDVVKIGKKTLVPADAAESWLKNLPTLRTAS